MPSHLCDGTTVGFSHASGTRIEKPERYSHVLMVTESPAIMFKRSATRSESDSTFVVIVGTSRLISFGQQSRHSVGPPTLFSTGTARHSAFTEWGIWSHSRASPGEPPDIRDPRNRVQQIRRPGRLIVGLLSNCDTEFPPSRPRQLFGDLTPYLACGPYVPSQALQAQLLDSRAPGMLRRLTAGQESPRYRPACLGDNGV